MKYQDVLEECLMMMRRGESIEGLVAAYPAFAEQLRSDLAAASTVRRITNALPPTSLASQRAFRTNLAAERERRRSTERRSIWSGLRTTAFGLAAASAVVLIIAFALSAGLVPSQTAEAGSIEGVVVENDNGLLTVQTEDGLQSIEVEPDLSVSDDSGATVDLASLEPGQFLVIRGKARDARVFQARRIELREAAALQTWCERNAGPCVELERALAQRSGECVRDLPVCQSIRTRLQVLRSQIAAASRLQELKDRCESGATVACREVQTFCATNPAACESLRDWLRSRRLR